MRYHRVLLTGVAGQLGHELARLLPALGDTIALDRTRLDLTDTASIRRVVRDARPDLIVNAAAYTAVDRAEAEPEIAHAVNARAPEVLAEEAHRIGALLVHFSTDYVFDGSASEPYREDAPVNPINVYGASKLAGERAVTAAAPRALVLRTSWIYGMHGHNFLLTMRRLARERDEIRVVDDQHGTPNWSRSLASATVAILDRSRAELYRGAGIYHLCSAGQTTWCGFARALLADLPDVRVIPITTADYPTPARRPRFSVLDASRLAKIFGVSMPHWEHDLRSCLARGEKTE
jgi:dTDP-4-dehydrorhamnose reductase